MLRSNMWGNSLQPKYWGNMSYHPHVCCGGLDEGSAKQAAWVWISALPLALGRSLTSLCLVSSAVRWGCLTRLLWALTAHNLQEFLTDQIILGIYSNERVKVLLIWGLFWHEVLHLRLLLTKHFKRISSHFSHSWSVIFVHMFWTHVFLDWLEMLCIQYLRCPKAVKTKISQLTHVC